jgi:hypothetical protein
MMFRQLTAKFNWWLKTGDYVCIFTCTVSTSVAEKSCDSCNALLSKIWFYLN